MIVQIAFPAPKLYGDLVSDDHAFAVQLRDLQRRFVCHVQNAVGKFGIMEAEIRAQIPGLDQVISDYAIVDNP